MEFEMNNDGNQPLDFTNQDYMSGINDTGGGGGGGGFDWGSLIGTVFGNAPGILNGVANLKNGTTAPPQQVVYQQSPAGGNNMMLFLLVGVGILVVIIIAVMAMNKGGK